MSKPTRSREQAVGPGPAVPAGGRTIGQRIRLARKAARLNQGQLADRLGVTQPTVANWEAGVHDPRQLVLGKLAEALDVSLGWLAGGETPEEARPAGTIPSYIRRGVQHVPILSAGAALRVRGGLDPHAASNDYLPFSYEGGRLVALRLPPDALPDGVAPDTLLVTDLSRRDPTPGALTICCDGEGLVLLAWQAGSARQPVGTVIASIRFH